MNSSWNEKVFDCIRLINGQLHGGYCVPEMASKLLKRMETCLCSGDGLTSETAFKAESETVMERTLGLLGLHDSVCEVRHRDCLSILSLSDNPYGLTKMYFTSI